MNAELDRILTELEACALLRERNKARAMVFQASLKDRAAEHFGVKRGTYYYLPFRTWEKIRSRYIEWRNSQ